MTRLRELRESLNLSAVRLCQLSKVSNKRISGHERGTVILTADERCKIFHTLRGEAERLRTLPPIPIESVAFD